VKLVNSGTLKKNTKAYKPDEKTGKWRGNVTKWGQYATQKPGWTGEFKIDGSNHRLEIWSFATKWGVESLYFKLFKDEEEIF